MVPRFDLFCVIVCQVSEPVVVHSYNGGDGGMLKERGREHVALDARAFVVWPINTFATTLWRAGEYSDI